MLPDELIRKVRLIEITTRKMVDDVMSGSYRSSFKGQGVQFSEHRVYLPGDDIRHIDWKVSARSRDPLIKKYEEERELTGPRLELAVGPLDALHGAADGGAPERGRRFEVGVLADDGRVLAPQLQEHRGQV